MELVDVTLTDLTRRSRTLRVHHATTALTRGLELGEAVLVRDGSDYYSAVIADIDFELEDTVYTVAIGGRVPADLAEEKLAGRAPAQDPDSLSLHDVIDLLGLARTARVPEPRRGDLPTHARSES